MNNFNFEVMDKNSIKYAKDQTDITREKFAGYYKDIASVIRPYVFTEKMKSVCMTKNKICYISINNGQNNLVVNDDVIYSTDGIIVWIKPENNGDRVALFETTGKDSGTLKVFRKKEIIYEENGFIHDIIFKADGFYIIKENRNEKVGDNNHSSNAVYTNGEYVFGKEIPAGLGIVADSYENKVVLTAADNKRTIIYTGDLEDPSTWKKFWEYDKQLKVLDYRQDKLYKSEIMKNLI